MHQFSYQFGVIFYASIQESQTLRRGKTTEDTTNGGHPTSVQRGKKKTSYYSE